MDEDRSRSDKGAWAGLAVAVATAALVFTFEPHARAAAVRTYEALYAKVFPCSKPMTYALGAFDDRFKLSRPDFMAAVGEAAEVWEDAAGRDLFAETDAGGAVTVDLVYDHRQEATDRLRELGIAIDDDRATYDRLKARLGKLEATLEPRRAAYDAGIASYEARKKTYERDVAYWNARGGAPKEEFERLNAEREALNAEAARLAAERDALNKLVGEFNALVTVINRLAKELNLSAAAYNDVIGERGEEFQEGSFTGDAFGGTIEIFEFDDRRRLVRVLTHEFGHALGLEHVEDPEAIMYRLNSGKNETPTEADLAALKARCRLQ